MCASVHHCHHPPITDNMHFAKTLEGAKIPWLSSGYIEYTLLKHRLREIVEASKDLPVARTPGWGTRFGAHDAASLMIDWITLFDFELEKVNSFTSSKLDDLKLTVSSLSRRISQMNDSQPAVLLAELDAVSVLIVDLEGFIRINGTAVLKIAKKYDRMLGQQSMPWVSARLKHQKFYNQKLDGFICALSDMYAHIRTLNPELFFGAGSTGVPSSTDAAGGGLWQAPEIFERTTSKYWVRIEDVTRLKIAIIRFLPVLVYGRDTSEYRAVEPLETPSITAKSDSGVITSIYYDSPSLACYFSRIRREEGAQLVRVRWYGAPDATGPEKLQPPPQSEVFIEIKTHHEAWIEESSVKERFPIKAGRVSDFMSGEMDASQHIERLVEDGAVKPGAAERLREVALAIQFKVRDLGLSAAIRTRYRRSAFQSADSNEVRVSLDTELQLLNEMKDSAPIRHPLDECDTHRTASSTATLDWCRTEEELFEPGNAKNVDFPYAVLEIKLSSVARPPWVADLLRMGLCTPVRKFSKFLTGAAVLLPTLATVLPHWMNEDGTLQAPSSPRTAAREALAVGGGAEDASGSGGGGADAQRKCSGGAGVRSEKDLQQEESSGASATSDVHPHPLSSPSSNGGDLSSRQAMPPAATPQNQHQTTTTTMRMRPVQPQVFWREAPMTYRSDADDRDAVAVTVDGATDGYQTLPESTVAKPPPAAKSSKQRGQGLPILMLPQSPTRLQLPWPPGSTHNDYRALGSLESPTGAPPEGHRSLLGRLSSSFARRVRAAGVPAWRRLRLGRGIKLRPWSSIFRCRGGGEGGDGGGGGGGPSGPHNAAAPAPRSLPPGQRARLVPLRIEPKTLFSLERTFLHYVSATLIVFALTTALLSAGTRNARIAGYITFPVAILFICYALWRYVDRMKRLERRDPAGYNDPVGPWVLSIVLIGAMIANVLALELWGDDRTPSLGRGA